MATKYISKINKIRIFIYVFIRTKMTNLILIYFFGEGGEVDFCFQIQTWFLYFSFSLYVWFVDTSNLEMHLQGLFTES